jgi:glycosyltransferase involved in cell wall biosynthesis
MGHDVSVLCVNHADKDGVDVTHNRWRKTGFVEEWNDLVHVRRLGRLFGLSRLEVCPNLFGNIREMTRNADVVHLHTPNPLMLVAWWLAGDRKVPLVLTHHSDVVKQRWLNLLVTPIEKKVYYLARKILSDSPNYIEGSKVLQGFSEKVETLPLGIDFRPFVNPTSAVIERATVLKNLNNGPLWLMVGRMTYYKGYHVALEALAKVQGNLVIVGTGPLLTELKTKATHLGLKDRVIWKSNVGLNELAAYYYAATALWFPSIARSEGFGLVQVEAMACGCPIINTSIQGSGVSWVSLNEVSGLTVEPENPCAFANAVIRIQSDESLRCKLARGAKERAFELFDAKCMASKSLALYESVIN